MTPKQAILAALNDEIKRPQLLTYLGIIKGSDGKYKYNRKEIVKKDFIPPTLQESIDFFKYNGYDSIGAKKAFEYYAINDWKDANGKPVKNWKQKFIGNWFRDEYKIKQQIYKTLKID